MRIHPSDPREQQSPVPDTMNEPIPRPAKEVHSTFHTMLCVAIVILIIFGVIMISYMAREKSYSETILDKEDLSVYEKKKFDDCIDTIWEHLLQRDFNQSNPNHLQPIRIKVFNTLRHLRSTYKRDLILFLYEHRLIRTDIPSEQRLDLHDADLNNIQFKNITLDYLYLPGVKASNSLFTTCRLKKSNFHGSIMDHSRFIDCALEESTFSGASLKQSSFTKDNILSEIDFTNTDLLGSDININGNTNILVNTRLPNGSFSQIDTKDLIHDGGAEQKCHFSRSDHWWNKSGYSSLTINHRQNNSCLAMTPTGDNNCYFQGNSTSRLIQDIDLNQYSNLIDNNRAWYNISGYFGCANTTRNDSATIELRFAKKHQIYDDNQVYDIEYGQTFEYLSNSSLIPNGIRAVRIMIGADIHNSTGTPASCCAIDDVKFHISEKNVTM